MKYNTLHKQMLRTYTKVGICEHCKQRRKTEWSNRKHDYLTTNLEEWQELCRRCHDLHDRAAFPRKKPRKRADIGKTIMSTSRQTVDFLARERKKQYLKKYYASRKKGLTDIA